MSRLASIEKAGFYPTPPSAYEQIAGHVQPSSNGGRLLDPCCGTGEPAAHLAKAWNLEAYGIEIDQVRAKASGTKLKSVLNLDYAKARVSKEAFQLLYLNPPYAYDESKYRRVEYRFLHDTLRWLQPGGLMVFLIPQPRLDEKMALFLATHFENLRIYRFPDPEFADFRQIVLFATKKHIPILDAPTATALVRQVRTALPVVPESTDAPYTLPAPTSALTLFRGEEIDPKRALAEAIASGVWTTREWTELFAPPSEQTTLRPLMPLKKGHLAMLIAAGLLRNLRLEREGERLLVKGRTRKVEEQVPSPDPNTEVVRQRFITEITALDLTTGNAERLEDPATLSQFIEAWRDEIAARVLSTLRPLYSFDYQEFGDNVQTMLNGLSRYRRLPGRVRTGLFEAQKHVAVALWRRLKEANYAICVGEMGVGKTTVATAVAALLERDGYPALVVCPPHLVAKWVREIEQIVPLATVIALKRVSDVDRFVAMAPRYVGRPLYAVMSREMAKLGSGWRPAFSRKRTRLRSPNGDGPVIELFTCTRCGEPIVDVNGGLVSDEAYFTTKRKCPKCQEPLIQFVRLNGEGESSFGDWIARRADVDHNPFDKITHQLPAKARFPLADYIAKHYPGLFRLLIVDEAHQYKGQSTDQGYAMGALVRACRKTLALTGTIFGGRATSLFYLLYRMSPEVRKRFRWSDAQAWAERYGVLERITKYDVDSDDGVGYYTAKRRKRTYVREMPGISPELVTQLLDSTAFMRLADLGFELPPYLESPHILSMDPDQKAAYDELKDTLDYEVRRRLAQGDQRLLGAYLQALLSYPNACFREEVVTDPDGHVVATAPSLGEDRLYPKERWLVELAKEERKKGRRVLVYCRQTATRDITARLAGLLKQAGLRATVLNASVDAQGRERWIRRLSARGVDVLITNPRLVETGLDLVAFQTVVFYEIEYSLYTLMQASRRTWRLGQTDEVDVHYAVYAGTMEYRAMTLIAQKLAAALLLYGDAVEGALIHETDAGEGFLTELARSVIEKAEVPDLNALFVEKGREASEAESFITDREVNLADDPVGNLEEPVIPPISPEEFRQLPLV